MRQKHSAVGATQLCRPYRTIYLAFNYNRVNTLSCNIASPLGTVSVSRRINQIIRLSYHRIIILAGLPASFFQDVKDREAKSRTKLAWVMPRQKILGEAKERMSKLVLFDGAKLWRIKRR